MNKRSFFASFLLATTLSLASANVSINVHSRSAESVFKEIMRQTGKNYVYNSGLLKGMKVTLKANDEPLESVLRRMFAGTGIEYSIKGNNVTLKRVSTPTPTRIAVSGHVIEGGTSEPLVGALVALDGGNNGVFTNNSGHWSMYLPEGQNTLKVSYPGFLARTVKVTVPTKREVNVTLTADTVGGSSLKEVVVTADINNSIAMRSAEVGHININVTDIRNTPVLLGEADVVKTLQMQPGVTQGMEGMAGMYVHGGAADENLILLDGVPIYQPTHFGGLFSSFNIDVVKNVDFYKSTFPARYGGRLSSVLDVHTKDGSNSGHHGLLRIGLTSGAFHINGPIGKRTTYSFGLRRSWYEILTVPGIALYNRYRQDNWEKTVARYAFMDINAKVTHTFSDGSRLHAMFYYGDDYLKGGSKSDTRDDITEEGSRHTSSDIARLNWGNILGSVGYSRACTPTLFSEFSLSVSHFYSSIKRDNEVRDFTTDGNKTDYENTLYQSSRHYKTTNDISDLIARAAFTWNAGSSQRLDFGAEYTLHFFHPQEEATAIYNGLDNFRINTIFDHLTANEASLYVSDDWNISDALRLNAGLRGGLYAIDGHTHLTLDPRVGVRWAVNDSWSIKGAYSEMSQYVHQVSESVLALPTDLWIPVAGTMKPQRSRNISLGVYWTFGNGFTFSAEGYWRWLRNLADYADYSYLAPKDSPWSELLCEGEGKARGLDLALTKSFGRVSGHVAYSLLWSDRRFNDKNGGRWYPDRFDNRHKINVSVSWKINDRWTANALWTGMSGNRYTLQTQNYQVLPDPDIPFIDSNFWSYSPDLVAEINGRRLPFYHRLDLSATLRTRHGEWTFSLYNAYCNMNPVAVRKQYWANAKCTFQYFRLLPAIPGVSYTWFF